jgi:hypothetical protein
VGGGRESVGGIDPRPNGRRELPEILAHALGRRDLQVIMPGEAARLAEQFHSRWRAAARDGDSERVVETSTPDTLVVESLLGWLAARLPPRQPLVLLAARGGEICGVRGLTPSALLRVHEIVRDSGESVHMMCPEGAFGLALENSARHGTPSPAKAAPSNGLRARGTPDALFKLFVWGAPR